ncbi:MAG: glycosyltransferase family 2 protein [Bacteroidetes bacterium]|nr:glycosyltransferase family 2 protein [Bacteroidota bacterium]
MTAQPLVSCIMPTANRARFIPTAIKLFLNQDYYNKELIIIDDGIKSVQHLIPNNPHIIYLRLWHGPMTIGTKRNYACGIAHGEIIIHLDDDDWYASDWVSHQVAILEETNADICGLSQLRFYAPVTGRCWKYTYPPDGLHWVAGATMAYRKQFWENNPFKDLQVGEDNEFVWYSNGKVVSHDYINGFISILHGRNTSPKHINSVLWQKEDVATVRGILKCNS